MKTLFKVLRNAFAVFGILFLAFLAFFYYVCENYDVSVNITELHSDKNKVMIGRLTSAKPFVSDTTSVSMHVVRDTARAREIREFFNLDSICAGSLSTWDKSLKIGGFVASHIPHANQTVAPKRRNAIDLWKYTKEVEPAFNCRLHSILTFELLLAADIKARFVTCYPQDSTDNDCHVVNEVWLPELNKWAMLDTDMGANFVTDSLGTPLSLLEMRNNYINDVDMFFHPGLAIVPNNNKNVYYYSYMAKNTYWLACWEHLAFFREDLPYTDSIPFANNRYINLVPPGFQPFHTFSDVVTTDADKFYNY
ncbi:MAG: transglutaminase domain-containing protein [Bacteroidales bacterium]|nr:transglutaminase domain-containing protein [Bacteroidales bacterium]